MIPRFDRLIWFKSIDLLIISSVNRKIHKNTQSVLNISSQTLSIYFMKFSNFPTMRLLNTCYVSILQYVSILCTRIKVLPNDAKINTINLINQYINAIIITMVYNFSQPLYIPQQSSSSNILLANRSLEKSCFVRTEN